MKSGAFLRRWTKPQPKYELLRDDTVMQDGQTLYRIRALRDFGRVREGELGGYIAGEHNLSHKGYCWVLINARVYGKARVSGNAEIGGRALAGGESRICDEALVHGEAQVCDRARVSNYALVSGRARIGGNAVVEENARVAGQARIGGNARVRGRIDDKAPLGLGKNEPVCGPESRSRAE